MTRLLPILAAALFLVSTGVSFAQPAPVPQAAPAAPPAAAGAEPKVSTKTFQDWVVRCPLTPQPLPCDAVQLQIEAKSKQRVLSISAAFDAAKGQHVVRIILPLGVWLPNGITIVAGETKLEKVAIKRCEPFGCIVEGALDPTLHEAMRKGGNAKIVIYDQAKKPLDLKFSLAGFGEAQDYMVAETKKVPPIKGAN